MSAEELQQEIKKLIQELGWTQAEAARRVFCELDESDDEDEIRRYVEAFKKKLSRSTTPPHQLRAIFEILCRQRAAEQLRTIKPTYVPSASLEPAAQKEMRAISRGFDREMADEEQETYSRPTTASPT